MSTQSENPYRHHAAELVRLAREGRDLPNGGFIPPPRPVRASAAPEALIFSPHPDDECIIGNLPIRLMREAGYRVANVAVTLGSNRDRREARLIELRGACEFLGFELVLAAPRGLERINIQTRESDPTHWAESVERIAGIIIGRGSPVLFFPHRRDWNSTHIGVHHLVMDALSALGDRWRGWVIQTEYWGAMDAPNAMVEADEKLIGDLMAATSFHVGEVTRNPFHLRLPAWMQDNVRRGTELVGGQGAAAPDYEFATLYRVGEWSGEDRVVDSSPRGRFLPLEESAERLFESK